MFVLFIKEICCLDEFFLKRMKIFCLFVYGFIFVNEFDKDIDDLIDIGSGIVGYCVYVC